MKLGLGVMFSLPQVTEIIVRFLMNAITYIFCFCRQLGATEASGLTFSQRQKRQWAADTRQIRRYLMCGRQLAVITQVGEIWFLILHKAGPIKE